MPKNKRNNRSLIPHIEVIKRYLDGESCVKISKIAKISPVGIIEILKRNGISRREKRIAEFLKRKYDYDAIINDYKNGMFLCHVANKYNTGASHILKILKGNGIKSRGFEGIRKGLEHHFWKGGKSHDRDGYIIEKRGRTHRIKMEEVIGRKLNHWEDVHHIDGDKKNYNLDNLVVIPSREHIRFHTLLRQTNLGINRENFEKFCREESELIWRFTRKDLIKLCIENNISLVGINRRKRIEKKCRIKKCNIISYTTKGFCSKHYQRFMAKKRGYWKSGRGNMNYLGKFTREKNLLKII